MREEMRNIEETCESQVEEALEEKEAQGASFAEAKKALEAKTEAVQTGFVKEQAALEKEQEKEKKRIRTQYEKEQAKMRSEFEKEKKQFEAEKDAALAAANKDMRGDLKRLREQLNAQCTRELAAQKCELEQAHTARVQQAKIDYAKRVLQLQMAVQQQLDGLKEACGKCLETQKQESDAKRSSLPSLGFSATSMMDPFAGIASPMMDPFAGIDMGDPSPAAQPVQTVQTVQTEQPAQAEAVQEPHLEDTAFDGFALGDYTTLPVDDAMVTVEAAPEVDGEQLTRLQSVGEARSRDA